MRPGTRDCVPAAAFGVGALRFGRYAFLPNQLGHCGRDDHAALLEYVARAQPDRGLVELERRFEGAYPYRALIAAANGIPDPFDERVVDAAEPATSRRPRHSPVCARRRSAVWRWPT